MFSYDPFRQKITAEEMEAAQDLIHRVCQKLRYSNFSCPDTKMLAKAISDLEEAVKHLNKALTSSSN